MIPHIAPSICEQPLHPPKYLCALIDTAYSHPYTDLFFLVDIQKMTPPSPFALEGAMETGSGQ